jgi:glycosyltransferase involved in cell wall biosynthesis
MTKTHTNPPPKGLIPKVIYREYTDTEPDTDIPILLHPLIMRIALVGPGIMPIPPPGWGAVEILIWDYYQELVRQGQEVDIVNPIRSSEWDQSDATAPYMQSLIDTLNQGNYDWVHIHYDCLYHMIPHLTCPGVAITSHFPYIDQPDKHGGYANIFSNICYNHRHMIYALSQKDYDMFARHAVDPSRIRLMVNGANHRTIVPTNDDTGPNRDRSIYIAKVEPRKQQHKYCTLPDVDFYGKCDDPGFRALPCYRGEKPHDELMQIMAGYGNLVLLSTGEADPLVIKEALMAGLPVVTNTYSSTVLDPSLPWVDIIPDDRLEDLDYIGRVIRDNRTKRTLTDEIRRYAVEHFSWEKLVGDYVSTFQAPPT